MVVVPIRLSTLFLRTLRDDPADAEVASHRLLVRAGYVRRAAPGIYSWLPLGWMVLRNVERIVREEMDRAGAQEVHFPALLPREPYEATGRWAEYGDNLFRLKDREGADYLLGPTHEEMFTLLVKDICTSYKDLPLSLYQIQTKYRDEARPRAGLLRGREFVMKDSYSFDLDDDGLRSPTTRHREAYIRDLRPARAAVRHRRRMSGAMGGSASEEFLAAARRRRGQLRRAARLRLRRQHRGGATRRRPPRPRPTAPAAHVEDTPETPTIADPRRPPQRPGRPATAGPALDVGRHAQERAGDGAPTRTARPPARIGVPGDREVDLKRLEAQLEPAQVRVFTDADFAGAPALVKGYIGPGAIGEQRAPLPRRSSGGRRVRAG